MNVPSQEPLEPGPLLAHPTTEVSSSKTLQGVPKIVWLMWTQGLEAAPLVVGGCYRSWQQRNPDWNVIFLDETNLEGYLGTGFLNRYQGITKQAFSDLVRINLLARYGGVWADATCYCQVPLDDWLGEQLETGFFAFAWTGNHYPVAQELTMWFLASHQDNYLLQRWCGAANAYWLNNPKLSSRPKVRRYFKWLNRSPHTTRYWFSYPLKRLLKLYPYFWMSFLFDELVRRDVRARQIWQATPKLGAEAPHRLKRVGILSPLTPILKGEIDAQQVPVYKLDWRYNQADYTEASVLHYLFSSVCAPPQSVTASD